MDSDENQREKLTTEDERAVKEQELLDAKFDELMMDSGGCGRFQRVMLISMFFCLNSSNFYLYNMSYLELVPSEYICTYQDGMIGSCVPDEFCGNTSVVSYTPDYSVEHTYHNWVEKWGLECRSDAQVGLLGSVTFIGWVITLIFVPMMSDIYGRKWIFSLNMLAQSIGWTIIMFTSNFWAAIFALFINGLCSTTRVQIGILYMMEFFPIKDIPLGGTLYFVMEIVCALFGVLYFSYLSVNSQGYLAIGYTMQIIGSIIAFFIPESPKYLFKKGLLEETSKVL